MSLAHPKFAYEKGLKDLGGGHFAWLQPDGGIGWSNAGLIVDSGETLLVDTLYDMTLTREMLSAMADASPAARDIQTIVNTHSNGDHCNGNGCCPKAEIVASIASAEEMDHESPEMMAALLQQADNMGEVGAYFKKAFGPFDFAGVERRNPTRTFAGRLDLTVGNKQVHLIEVGPAHTKGDVLVHVPDDKIVYTGDILFVEGTPIMWAGPVSNWIKACDDMLALDLEAVVPGHGPITDKKGVQAVRDYLTYITDEARKRFDSGMTDPVEAARDIALNDYESWGDPERIIINVHTLYREFQGITEQPNPAELFGPLAALHYDRNR